MKNERKLEELYSNIEEITAAHQDKFVNDIEIIIYDNIQKFRTLLNKELNTIFQNISSHSMDLFQSHHHIHSNFNKKELMRSLLAIVKNL